MLVTVTCFSTIYTAQIDAFPMQQRLKNSAAMLRYAYIAPLMFLYSLSFYCCPLEYEMSSRDFTQSWLL
jgi:hypothetical protein